MPEPADLLIHNARVFTADPDLPRAEAIAIRGNRILFVGSDEDAVSFRGPNTRVIAARQRTVLPGFIDSHFHLLMGALELRTAQLQEVRSLEQLTETLRSYAAAHPDSEWVEGNGIVYGILPDGQPLTRQHLDAIIVDRPLVIESYDGHTAWANTEALRRSGLLHGKAIGGFGEIVMDADGLAAGELREWPAYESIFDLIPQPSANEKCALLIKAMQMAAAYGLTSVHNMDGDLEQLGLYASLERDGEMLLRVYVPLSMKPESSTAALQEALAMRARSTRMVRGGLVKFFMDGVIESFTGLLLDDYAERPGWRGTANFEPEHFTDLAVEADRLGLQIAVHCTGDGAVRRVLDAYELARGRNGARDSRHRIEHIELVGDSDLPRFADLGVIAAMQPLHSPTQAWDPWPARVGPERWRRSFAWSSLRDAGARLAFGSDWSVVSMNPLTGIHAAVTRRPWQEGDPNQSQTLEQALLGYTRDAAYAEFMEHEKGMLKVGYFADVVMLSEDIFETPADELLRIHPLLTICDGRVTFENTPSAL
ncbi:MAG: amidohydrolase [Chloroflexota bacterium]